MTNGSNSARNGQDEAYGAQSKTSATLEFQRQVPKSESYEYQIQKIAGMTAEECILLAVALDLQKRKANSSILLTHHITEMAVL